MHHTFLQISVNYNFLIIIYFNMNEKKLVVIHYCNNSSINLYLFRSIYQYMI